MSFGDRRMVMAVGVRSTYNLVICTFQLRDYTTFTRYSREVTGKPCRICYVTVMKLWTKD